MLILHQKFNPQGKFSENIDKIINALLLQNKDIKSPILRSNALVFCKRLSKNVVFNPPPPPPPLPPNHTFIQNVPSMNRPTHDHNSPWPHVTLHYLLNVRYCACAFNLKGLSHELDLATPKRIQTVRYRYRKCFNFLAAKYR